MEAYAMKLGGFEDHTGRKASAPRARELQQARGASAGAFCHTSNRLA